MNLRARLLLILLLALALPAGLMGWRFYQERLLEIEQAQVRLSSLARRIGDEIDSRIQGTAQLQYGLSRAHDLDTTDRAACSEFLSAVREEYPQYTGILTIQPDGALFCDSLRTGRQLDLRDREYFKQAQTLRGAVALQPAFGRLTGISVLQIAYPVHDGDGPLKYVLLASLNLDKFTAERQREFIAPRPQLLLVDRKGACWRRPAKELTGRCPGRPSLRLGCCGWPPSPMVRPFPRSSMRRAGHRSGPRMRHRSIGAPASMCWSGCPRPSWSPRPTGG